MSGGGSIVRRSLRTDKERTELLTYRVRPKKGGTHTGSVHVRLPPPPTYDAVGETVTTGDRGGGTTSRAGALGSQHPPVLRTRVPAAPHSRGEGS